MSTDTIKQGVHMKKSTELKSLARLWPYQGDLDNIDFNVQRASVIASVAARIDFAGGWTDSPRVFTKHKASILAASMSFGAASGQHAITAVVGPATAFRFSVDDALEDVPELLAYMLKYLGFANKLNYPPIAVNLYNIIPRGSGLGGSGLVIAVTLAALFAYYRGIEYPLDNLLRLVEYPIAIEQMQGTCGSWNDTVPGLLPGIKLIQTNPSDIHRFTVQRLPQNIADELAQRCILINLQHPRKAAPFCRSIQSGFENGDTRTVRMIDSIERYAREMWKHLIHKDFSTFGNLMGVSWKEVCAVEMQSTIPIVAEIEKLLALEIDGMKIGGAGGGGFTVIVAKSPEHRDRAVMKLRRKFPDQGLDKQIRIYAPQFPSIGLQIGYLNPLVTTSFDDQPTITIIK